MFSDGGIFFSDRGIFFGDGGIFFSDRGIFLSDGDIFLSQSAIFFRLSGVTGKLLLSGEFFGRKFLCQSIFPGDFGSLTGAFGGFL